MAGESNTSRSNETTRLASSGTANKPNKRNQLQMTEQQSPKEPTARIETLDDLSHRLDQTRENVPLEMDDTRVPFWNIAHMINAIEQVDLALGLVEDKKIF